MTESSFMENRKKYIKSMNKTIRHAKASHYDLSFPTLNSNQLHIIGYSDASFANNMDQSSQLGYIILIGADTGNVIPITFKSYKARRVCRSAMAAETIEKLLQLAMNMKVLGMFNHVKQGGGDYDEEEDDFVARVVVWASAASSSQS